MEKEEIIRKYINYFEKLLSESDEREQEKIGKKIADFSIEIYKEVEEKYPNSPLENIQASCLAMEHWEDETGYCGVNENDIKNFLEQLKNMLKTEK